MLVFSKLQFRVRAHSTTITKLSEIASSKKVASIAALFWLEKRTGNKAVEFWPDLSNFFG